MDIPSATAHGDAKAPLAIQEQGSFAVGGTVWRAPDGRDDATLHGDHAYVAYQVPVRPRPHPLVFLHGNSQSTKTWETTPDGREGFQTLFLRRGYAVYLIDQPRRGKAGRSTQPAMLTPAPDDQTWFGIFRVGIWPGYFPGVQFSQDPAALDQYFRQITPNTGPFDLEVNAKAVAALFDKTGPGVLVTHSQGGGAGWLAATRTPAIRAIVSYEPGSNFIFPEGEVPAAMPSAGGTLTAMGAPIEDFLALTRLPVMIVYGDYIPEQPSPNPGQDQWRVRLAMARLWAQAVNRHGGDVTLVHLPEIGIRGNTHFPFSDLNNAEIADHMARFLAEKGLD